MIRTWVLIGSRHYVTVDGPKLLSGERVDVVDPRDLIETLEEVRDLVAKAYREDEHNDSPGNMAFAMLVHLVEQLEGRR